MTADTRAPSRLGIDWTSTLAGALAAVSAAVLLSTVGAAGTLLGAVLGSLVASIGTALYSRGLAASRRRLAKAQDAAREKVRVAQAEVLQADRAESTVAQEGHLGHAEEQLAEAQAELDAVAADVRATEQVAPTWKERLAALPWRRVALMAGALFVVTIVVITVFELLAGRSVASYTGGSGQDDRTTIGDVGGGGSSGERRRDRPTQGSPSPSETEQPTEQPTDQPTDQPTEQPTPSDTPSGTVEPSPTEAPASPGLGESPPAATEPVPSAS